MKFNRLEIPGLWVIEPDVHRDERGYFLEIYHERKYKDAGLPADFVQDNQSHSVKGTLRGLHAQMNTPQGKLVRVLQGEIWDVAVDARPHSPFFGKWAGVKLSATAFNQFYIPPGFFHGFCILTGEAVVSYKCTTLYDPKDEIGVAYNDPDLKILWPITQPLVSPRDSGYSKFSEVKNSLEKYRNLPLEAKR